MNGAYEKYLWLKYEVKNGNCPPRQLKMYVNEYGHDICVELAELFVFTMRDCGYSNADINSKSKMYIRRIEGDESDLWKERLGKWYARLTEGDNENSSNGESLEDPISNFLDMKDLGECIYEEMKKFCKQYRAKLDKNNEKRRLMRNNNIINENKTMNKKQTIRLNESKLKEIVKEYVKNVINENKLHDVEMFIRDGETMDEMYMISRQIANVFGDDSLAKEICNKMYWAVIDFLKGRI